MRVSKLVTGVLAGSLVAGAVGLALAGPAMAADEGPLLPGNIRWHTVAGPLDVQTAATTISSGVSPTAGVNPRPWTSLTVDQNCPAGTTSAQVGIRIPQVGVPENDWDQVPVGAVWSAQDAQGRFYMNVPPDRLNRAQITQYNLDHPNAAGNQFPFVVACRDSGGIGLGYFKTTITVVGGSDPLNYSWSIPAAPPLAASPSTTTLATSAASVEAGTPVTLTATVTPTAATGSVEFFAGTTSLGTAVLSAGSAALTTSAIPVGTNSVTAAYLGGSNAASTSGPVTVTVTPTPARPTTTVLSVSPLAGAPYQAVTLSTTVTAATGLPNGTVTFKDGAAVIGTALCTNGVVGDITVNSLNAGAHSLTAVFVGTAPYSDSTSAAVAATYTQQGASDDQTVVVTIPQGAITITTPYTPAAPLNLGTAVLDPATSTYSSSAPFQDIVITDTRAGNLGFTASVVTGAFDNGAGSTFGGQYAGLTGLVATQVVGNALLAGDLVLTNNAAVVPGLATPKVFAAYPAGHSVGTAHLNGVFGIAGVPTSVQPGTYTSTVTFTAV
ncbi:Ig-like domain repeat protein [Cellulomonas sp. ICMP 17802]|uniref:Ig-like domain repeat protein n=1 Tax=Cellulomonas sp. ICMP 17802 TaxID=3239199 RepID=UPI00351AE835